MEGGVGLNGSMGTRKSACWVLPSLHTASAATSSAADYSCAQSYATRCTYVGMHHVGMMQSASGESLWLQLPAVMLVLSAMLEGLLCPVSVVNPNSWQLALLMSSAIPAQSSLAMNSDC